MVLASEIFGGEVTEEPEKEEVIEVVKEPREVLIRVDYTTEGIKELIRETFPEDAETALAIADCESSFRMIQSHHMQPYGRERSFGIFQIHEPAWHHKALELGLPFYQEDIEQNIKMARYIYEQHGWSPWSCLRMI